MIMYRVDRAESLYTPCGMGSIVLLTHNKREAQQVFARTEPGRDKWNRPDPRYGVLLSETSSLSGDYQPVKFKRNEG